jgi:hypothetical protein
VNVKRKLELHFSTGNPQVDDLLQGIVGIYESAFPGKLKAYYLTGSYYYGDPIPTSDVDLNVIFRGNEFDSSLPELKAPPPEFMDVTNYLHLLSPIELGFLFKTEEFFRRNFSLSMCRDRVFLFGEDLLGELSESAIPSRPFSPRNYMHRAYEVLCRRHGVSDTLETPLEFPAPEEEFYGYANLELGAYGRPALSVSALKNCAYEPTTVLISLEIGDHVWGRKDQLGQLYRTHINDQYSQFIEDFFNCAGKPGIT